MTGDTPAATGPAMPWDGPLNTIRSSLSGTVAHVLITVAVIVTGLVFAFTEHGSGARRLFGVAFFEPQEDRRLLVAAAEEGGQTRDRIHARAGLDAEPAGGGR